jgi:hypothetical protein
MNKDELEGALFVTITVGPYKDPDSAVRAMNILKETAEDHDLTIRTTYYTNQHGFPDIPGMF